MAEAIRTILLFDKFSIKERYRVCTDSEKIEKFKRYKVLKVKRSNGDCCI